MSVAAGAAVGGGSLIYANISCEAPPAVFEPAGAPEITYPELKPHYDAVASFMDVQPVPDNQWTGRMKLMQDAAVAAGFGDRFKKLELAVSFDPDWTYDSRLCQGRSRLDRVHQQAQGVAQAPASTSATAISAATSLAKNTLDRNYIYVAEKQVPRRYPPAAPGRPDRAASERRLPRLVRQPGDRPARSRLRNCSHRHRRGRLARLDRAVAALPRHPHRRCPSSARPSACTGAATAISSRPPFYPFRDVEASKGPTIASAIDFQDGSQAGKKFWIQDGGIPDLAIAYLLRKADDPSDQLQGQALIDGLRHSSRRPSRFVRSCPGSPRATMPATERSP